MQCSHKTYILSLVLLVTTVTLSGPALAVEKETGAVESNQSLGAEAQEVLQDFEYRLEGRADPFVPFISNKRATQKIGADDIIEDDVELTGMRLFEPGQLTLVAVLYSGDKRMAMVEDVTGKGYILNEGMPIGRRGVVNRIDPEQVTVIETAQTRAGRKLQNKIFMRLNKEGDK